MQKWEYDQMPVGVSHSKRSKKSNVSDTEYWWIRNGEPAEVFELAEMLMIFGDEGWELVHISEISFDGETKQLTFYFKRPKQDDSPPKLDAYYQAAKEAHEERKRNEYKPAKVANADSDW